MKLYSADGTSKDVSLFIKTKPMVGASSTVNGESGAVPAPTKGDTNRYLRSDGTWSTVTGMLKVDGSDLVSTATSQSLCPRSTGEGNLGTATRSWGSVHAGTITTSGNISAAGTITGSKVYNAVYNDYAEYFEKGEEVEAGDIIALDDSNEEKYVKATDKSKVVVGVCSDEYAHIIGGDGENSSFIPVGLVGRVHVKVIGEVEKGDYIVPFSLKGIGIASKSKEHSIGQAVESNHDTTIKKVRVFLCT